MNTYSIGTVAELLGISRDTLRYYENGYFVGTDKNQEALRFGDLPANRTIIIKCYSAT